MPSPWDNRDRFYRAASYVDVCSEALLHQLSGYLNRVHGTDYSEKYWRIVLGPWLILYSHVLYDRFVHLQSVFDGYSSLETIVMHESSFRTPADFPEAESFVASDAYNLQIFSQLLKLMGFSFPAKRYDGPFGSAIIASWRDRLFSGLEKLMRAPFAMRARTTLRKTNLSPVDTWKLAVATRFRALPLDFSLARTFDRGAATFNENRIGLAALPCDDSFQRILRELLPIHFPTIYLEGYKTASARSAQARHTPVLVSGYGWFADEEYKFSAAHAAEMGSQLVAVQHGGGYGVYRSAPYETHERRLADCFLAWGWASDQTRGIRNIVNPRFRQLENQRRRRRPGNSILFIANAHPRYPFRFQSSPTGTQWDAYFEWQKRFVTGLSERLQSLICFRPYPTDYGHIGQYLVRQAFPHLSWDESPRLADEKLVNARVVVIDHLATTALEALAANIPTILFWDPNRWEVRPEVREYFDNLRQAEILLDSPDSASEKLSRVYAEPECWWNTPRVQTARKEFVNCQAFTEKDWIRNWVDNLEAISKGAGGLA
jgi:putative transferase (TIGR04331 family)